MKSLFTSFLVLLTVSSAQAESPVPYSPRYLGSIPGYEHVGILDAPEGSPYALKHTVTLCPAWGECGPEKRIVGSPLDDEGRWHLIKPVNMPEERALALVLEAMQKVHNKAHLQPRH